MKFKKLIYCIAVIAFNFVFAFQVTAKDSIALVVSTLNNPFFVTLKNGAVKEANDLGYNLVILDSQNNPAKELSNIEDIIVKNVKVILINPTDSDAVGNAVLAANKSGIPVITLDRASNKGKVASHVASDNALGGKMAGDFIAEKLGKNINVLQLQGIVGTSASRERGKGFQNSAKDHGFKILSAQPADFDRAKGMNVMQNLLTAYPKVQAVFAENDEMALGAIRAIQTAGRDDILVVGFDGTDDGQKAVKSGRMGATIAQQPNLIGSMGVKIADRIIKNEKVDQKIPVDLKLIVK